MMHRKPGKYILALKCLNAALALKADPAQVHERVVAFHHTVKPLVDSLPLKVAEVIRSEFTVLPLSEEANQFNDVFYSKAKDDAALALAAIRSRRTLGGDRAQCEQALVGLLQIDGVRVEDARVALSTLKSWRSSEAAEMFEKTARAKWPEVTRFA
jgi:hypothetical protein